MKQNQIAAYHTEYRITDHFVFQKAKRLVTGEYSGIMNINCVIHQIHNLAKQVNTMLDCRVVSEAHTIISFFTLGVSAQLFFVRFEFPLF